MVTLDPLDEDALTRILTEPKNALCRQYALLEEMDGVELTFTDGAVRAIARQALARKTGARGLRAIIEDVMLDTMFDLPSHPEINACLVDEETINGGQPKLTTGERKPYKRTRKSSSLPSASAV